jgi:Tfp pilus assembly protein PilO
MWAASMWVVLSLMLLIVLLVLALRPTLVTISALMGQIKQQAEISKKLDSKIVTVRKALDALESIQDKIPLLETALPKEPKWEVLTHEVETIAKTEGMTIASITVDKIPADKQVVPVGVIPVRFSLIGSGDYDQVYKTIVKIEKMGRLVIIRNVTMVQNKEGGINMTLEGEVGFL